MHVPSQLSSASAISQEMFYLFAQAQHVLVNCVCQLQIPGAQLNTQKKK